MLRLAGILTGSALAIAVLVFFIGMPQLTEPTLSADSSEEIDAPAQIDVAVAALPSGTERPAGEFAPVMQPEPTPEPDLQPDAEVEPQVVETVAVTSREPRIDSQSSPAIESRWYAFWSPFRSALAADGFVSELQRTTGLDYRIVKLKPGVYEVAFAYSDDADRDDKLSRIAAATGLDVSGG